MPRRSERGPVVERKEEDSRQKPGRESQDGAASSESNVAADQGRNDESRVIGESRGTRREPRHERSTAPSRQERRQGKGASRHVRETRRGERRDHRPEREGDERARAEAGSEPLRDSPNEKRRQDEHQPNGEDSNPPELEIERRPSLRCVAKAEQKFRRNLEERDTGRLVRVEVTAEARAVEDIAEAPVGREPTMGKSRRQTESRGVLR